MEMNVNRYTLVLLQMFKWNIPLRFQYNIYQMFDDLTINNIIVVLVVRYFIKIYH
jgi:hypothetical protein